MVEEEKEAREKDILFQIDMQLYDEYNDTIATMNDHLGDIYSLRDIEEVEKAEKEEERKLLRKAVRNLQTELDKKDKAIDLMEEKLMYALSPTTHELAENSKSNFKRIIKENIDEDTYTIRLKLKKYWKGEDV